MAESINRTVLTRREALLLSATAGLSVATVGSALASDSIKTGAHPEPGNVSTPRSAIAKTQYGKVRGFLDGMRSPSSSTGTAQNQDWPSTALWCFGIAATSNPGDWPPGTINLRLGALYFCPP